MLKKFLSLFLIFIFFNPAESFADPTVSLGSGFKVSSTYGLDLYPPNYYNLMIYDNDAAYNGSLQAIQHPISEYVESATPVISFTGNITSGSKVVLSPSSSAITWGQGITGTGIPSSPLTYVIGIPETFTGTTSTSSLPNVITGIANIEDLRNGQVISTPNFPAGTTITNSQLTGSSIQVSSNATISSTVSISALFTLSASASATTTGVSLTGSASFTNNYDYDQAPGDFTAGWTFTVVAHPNASGAVTINGGAYNCTGSLTGNGVASQLFLAGGATFNLPSACAATLSTGDLVTIQSPSVGITPWQNRWSVLSGSATLSQDTTTANLHPVPIAGLTQLPANDQISVGSGGATIVTQTDTNGTLGIILNGTQTQSIDINLISGSCSVSFLKQRQGQSPVISGGGGTLSSGWSNYSATGTGSETASTAAGNINHEIIFSGGPCVLDLTGYESTGGSSVSTTGTLVPWAHMNSSPFSDTVFNYYKRGGYKRVRVNYAVGAGSVPSGGTFNNLIYPIKYRMQTNVSQQNYTTDSGVPVGIYDWLALIEAIGGDGGEYALPQTWVAGDYTNLMAYIYAPCTDPIGSIRCHTPNTQGVLHTAPFNIPHLVFSWNETWNNMSTGQFLGNTPYYGAIGLAQVAAAAIHASPYYAGSGVKFTVPMQPSATNLTNLAIADPSHIVDGGDLSAYHHMNTTTPTASAMLLDAIAEMFGDGNVAGFEQYDIGSNGTFVSTYEEGAGYINGACTTTSCVGEGSGLGSGIVEFLAAFYAQNFATLQTYNQWVLSNGPSVPYSSTGSPPATVIDIWSRIANLRGVGAFPDGSYLASSLFNFAAGMGTKINTTITTPITFNSGGTNGIPVVSNVRLTEFGAWCNGSGTSCTDSQRAYAFINSDTTSHTFTVDPSLALVGAVTQTVYHSTNGTPSPLDNNRTLNGTQVVQNTVTTPSYSSTVTVAPLSITLIQGSIASAPSAGWAISGTK